MDGYKYKLNLLIVLIIKIITVLFYVVPFAIIPLQWWIMVPAILLQQMVPIVGDAASLIIWVWAFVVSLRDPGNILSIMLYIGIAYTIVRLFLVYIVNSRKNY